MTAPGRPPLPEARVQSGGQPGKRLKVALAAVLAVLLLWAAVETAAPLIASSYVKREIRRRYTQVSDLSVSIRAFPGVKLAFRRYDRLKVAAGNVTLQGVPFERISLDSPGWPGATFEAYIGRDDIGSFFSLASSYLVDPVVRLEEDAFVVEGSVDTGGSSVEVEATGTLRALNGKLVYFEPTEVRAGGVQVTPGGLETVRRVMDQSPIFVVREDLPWSITGMAVEGGRLKISGNVNLGKALDFRP